MRSLLIFSAVGSLGAGAGVVLTPNAKAQPAHMWEIGPILAGRNVSVGMPANPTPDGRGWHFDFPYPNAAAGHVHYLTTRTGPLVGKSKIVMRYRIDAPPGVRIVARHNPQTTATLSLYFQRHGDNWSGRGPFEHYRWYATVANRIPLTPGEHEVSLSLEAQLEVGNVSDGLRRAYAVPGSHSERGVRWLRPWWSGGCWPRRLCHRACAVHVDQFPGDLRPDVAGSVRFRPSADINVNGERSPLGTADENMVIS